MWALYSPLHSHPYAFASLRTRSRRQDDPYVLVAGVKGERPAVVDLRHFQSITSRFPEGAAPISSSDSPTVRKAQSKRKSKR